MLSRMWYGMSRSLPKSSHLREFEMLPELNHNEKTHAAYLLVFAFWTNTYYSSAFTLLIHQMNQAKSGWFGQASNRLANIQKSLATTQQCPGNHSEQAGVMMASFVRANITNILQKMLRGCFCCSISWFPPNNVQSTENKELLLIGTI